MVFPKSPYSKVLRSARCAGSEGFTEPMRCYLMSEMCFPISGPDSVVFPWDPAGYLLEMVIHPQATNTCIKEVASNRNDLLHMDSSPSVLESQAA